MRARQPFSNPYVAGVGLGLVLLASFVVVGRGLGASGAVAACVAACVNAVAPVHAEANQAFARYLGTGLHRDWIVLEVLGVAVGGYVSARLAGRAEKGVDKGPRVSVRTRFLLAVLGGMLVGVGAKLARGCPSGQALTGGAMLSAGAWAFMMAVFAGGYAFAGLMRRQWN